MTARKKKYEFKPTPGTYEGTCPHCGKVIRVSEDDIALAGSPPEFPTLIQGHCGYCVEMSLVKERKRRK